MRSHLGGNMSVTYSVLLIAATFVAVCTAGTVNNRPAFGQTKPQGGKTSNSKIMHAGFENAGRTPGLHIWRVENFEPVPYPPNDYGKFYSGDSYIVLNTIEGKDAQKTLSWDVHYWLGSETSSDEAGAAAILTVQLDDQLLGAPVQHREVQDHESQLFLSYFKNGIRYEKGGVGSGFKHVETNAAGEKRLFHVKGKRNIRVRQVYLSVSSMNNGDSFILDAGNDIYVYSGVNAKRVEKLKAISAANGIRDQDHNGRATVHIVDTAAEKEEFFSVLGSGSPKDIPDESVAGDDEAFETTDAASVKLYKISDEGGKLKITPINAKPLRQNLLDTNDCFVLDTGSGIFVWVGRRATQAERTDALKKAEEFLRTQKYPAWTQIHRIVEGSEPTPFKQYFVSWKDAGMAHSRLIRSVLGEESDVALSNDEIDAFVRTLKKSSGQAIGFLPDNGQEDIEEIIFFSTQAESNEIRQSVIKYKENMPLLGFGSYIITYNYKSDAGESGSIVYVWQGTNASKEANELAWEQGLTLANERQAVLVRTKQNHEPRHFYKIFKGKLLTTYTALPTGPQLFRIRGTDASDVHASEVRVDSSSLSTSDVFALITQPELKIWIWIGLGASKFEQQMAKERFNNYWKDVEAEIIEEGAEPSEFFDVLGGEGSYDRSLTDDERAIMEPRLIHCRLTSRRRVKFEEVHHFQQSDLNPDDIMLVDAGDEIYVWIGSGATKEENEYIVDMVKKYTKREPSSRTIVDVNIIRILQEREPHVFKLIFPSWDDDYWQSLPTYEEYKNAILEAQSHNIAHNII